MYKSSVSFDSDSVYPMRRGEAMPDLIDLYAKSLADYDVDFSGEVKVIPTRAGNVLIGYDCYRRCVMPFCYLSPAWNCCYYPRSLSCDVVERDGGKYLIFEFTFVDTRVESCYYSVVGETKNFSCTLSLEERCISTF